MSYLETADQFALTFVHKRLLGAAKSFVTSGFNPVAAAGGFFARPPTAPPVRRPPPRQSVARPSERTAAGKELGRTAKFAGDMAPTTSFTPRTLTGRGRCVLPLRPDPRTGECRLFLGTQTGRDDTPIPSGNGARPDVFGEAVMGRYGAALAPGNMVVDRAVCPRGMTLGDDELCYNKGQITNRQRMWPAGRKPLLTGGDMRAISVAAAAGRRLERASKRLQKIGLMKKPAPRARRITSGPTDHHHHP